MKPYLKFLLAWVVLQPFVAPTAETNLTFDVLHTAQGDFTNAVIWRVMPSVVWVNYQGGFVSVRVTNLPPELQMRVAAWEASNQLAQAQRKLQLQAVPPTAPPRTWTFHNGQTVAGAYVSSGTTTVVIRRSGTNCFLQISDLSTNDQAYAAKMKSEQEQARLKQEQARLEAAAAQEQVASEHLAAVEAIVGIYGLDGQARGFNWAEIDLRSDGTAMVFRGGDIDHRRGQSGAWTFANKSITVSAQNRQETFKVEGDDLIDSQAHRWLHIR